MSQSYLNFGNLYKAKKDYPTSLEYFQKALQNKIKQYGLHHKDLVKTYKNISEVYYLMGNTEEGDKFRREAEESNKQ